MAGNDSALLEYLAKKHGALAALLLDPRYPSAWIGALSQSDYARLLFLQSLRLGSIASVDMLELSIGPVIINSRLMPNSATLMLVFQSGMRLKDIHERTLDFVQGLTAEPIVRPVNEALQGLKARKTNPAQDSQPDLQWLFGENEQPVVPLKPATPDLPALSKDSSALQTQVLEKSNSKWFKIF